MKVRCGCRRDDCDRDKVDFPGGVEYKLRVPATIGASAASRCTYLHVFSLDIKSIQFRLYKPEGPAEVVIRADSIEMSRYNIW